MPFNTYSADEARDVASAFVNKMCRMTSSQERRNLPKSISRDTGLWTEWTLDWWSLQAPSNVVTDARPLLKSTKRNHGLDKTPFRRRFDNEWTRQRDTSGEFLVDLMHSLFPSYNNGWGTPAYWNATFEQATNPEVLLALESEVGREGDREETIHSVMEDAVKLLFLSARIKTMIFSSVDMNDSRNEILELAGKMVSRDRTPFSAWIWIDSPWVDTPPCARVYSRPHQNIICDEYTPNGRWEQVKL
jgi:hypothetical protein